MQCAECRERLDAYLDGELTPGESEMVRGHVEQCANCGREHAVLSATSRRLKDGLMYYEAPDMLRARIVSALSRPAKPADRVTSPWMRWSRLAAAAVVIAFASSGVTVAVLHRGDATRAVAGDVLASHVRSLMPGHLTDVASNDQHNVKPWFNGRVDLSPPVPRLDSAGFPLLGGRLDYVASRQVAAVIYGRRQHIITVYSWASPGDDESPSSLSTQGYHMMRWRSGQVESWVISDLNASELAQFVALFRRSSS